MIKNQIRIRLSVSIILTALIVLGLSTKSQSIENKFVLLSIGMTQHILDTSPEIINSYGIFETRNKDHYLLPCKIEVYHFKQEVYPGNIWEGFKAKLIEAELTIDVVDHEKYSEDAKRFNYKYPTDYKKPMVKEVLQMKPDQAVMIFSGWQLEGSKKMDVPIIRDLHFRPNMGVSYRLDEERTYHLEAKVTNSRKNYQDRPNYFYNMLLTGPDGVIQNLSALKHSDFIENYSEPTIHFWGDIDGDKIPDLIMSYPGGDTEYNYMVYLSSLAEEGEILHLVASMTRGSGC